MRALALTAMIVGFTAASFPTTCVEGKHFKTSQVCGKVVDEQGAEIPGAEIEVQPTSGKAMKASTGNDGAFRFSKLPAGKYRLLARNNGFANVDQPFEVSRPSAAESCKKPIRVVMKLAGSCSYVANAWDEKH